MSAEVTEWNGNYPILGSDASFICLGHLLLFQSLQYAALEDTIIPQETVSKPEEFERLA